MGNLIKSSVCTIIEGQKKLMVPMLDSFWKHVGPCKALVAKSFMVQFEFLIGRKKLCNLFKFFTCSVVPTP